MTNTTTSALDTLAAKSIDDHARRIVETDVCYCVSALVSELFKGTHQEGAILSDDDAATLAHRQPDADDYRDAAAGPDIGVAKFADGYRVCGAESELYESKLDAWRAAFDLAGEDHPDGSEVYEHWLVTDWLADKLEEQGESVARDVAGLTIWGRCTSGQAIYADAVIQRIARDVLEA